MQRVNLGKPYEDYIKKLVKEGYYASASEVLRDALRAKMSQPSILTPKKSLKELVQEGIKNVEAGRVVPYSKNVLNKAYKNALANRKKGKLIPSHIVP